MTRTYLFPTPKSLPKGIALLFVLASIFLLGCTGGGSTNSGNNGVGSPTSLTATAGSAQSSAGTAAFATPLQVTVKDASGNLVSNVTVTFTAPSTGASGTFANGTATTTATTSSGVATASTFTANSTAGSYAITATVTGISGSISFNLTNTPPPASILATTGSTQSATISTAFTTALEATVKDASGNLVPNVTVTFTAPSTSPNGTFANGTATTTAVTNSSGIATASTFTADSTAGPYSVTAAVSGVGTSASFRLTNIAVVAVTISPKFATVQTGAAQQFTPMVTGTTNTTVSWSVAGVHGGNSTVGTISTTGLYTAPSSVPSANPVAVTETSVADTTKSATAEVTVSSSVPAITSLSSASLAPLNLLTITGSGFDSTAVVNFSSTSVPFSVNLQPVVVSQTSLIVSVPVLYSGATFVSAAVTVAVVQSSGQSNGVQLQIGSVPPAPPLAPGTVTLGFLEGELSIATQLNSEAPPSPLPSDLAALISALNLVIPPIRSVVNGTASSANLGSFNGKPVILGAAELTQMDQLSLALLQALANTGGIGSLSSASSTLARLMDFPRVNIVPAAQSSSTGCISQAAEASSMYQVNTSGAGTFSYTAQNLAYLSNTSAQGSDLIIKTLELVPAAILLVPESGALAVPASLAVSAEIFEGVTDVYRLGNYFHNPAAATGSDKVQVLQTLIGFLGPAGKILTFGASVSNYQKDLQSISVGAPPNPQAAACVSATFLNFGTVAIGGTPPSSSQSVTLTSIGTAPLTITTVVVAGPPDFSPAQTNCVGTLAAPTTGSPALYTSCTITSAFTPSRPGRQSAALSIYGAPPSLPIVIDMFGTGQLVATSDAITPSTIDLGSVGGCAGGSLSRKINVSAAPGVTWTWPPNTGAGDPTLTFNPVSGSGSEVVTVTDTRPPQTPTLGGSCSNPQPIPETSYIILSFSDGPSIQITVNYTYDYVN
jgi:hypothetical protein